MKQNTKDYVVGKVNELKETPNCCQGLKEECRKWLDALGTENKKPETDYGFTFPISQSNALTRRIPS